MARKLPPSTPEPDAATAVAEPADAIDQVVDARLQQLTTAEELFSRLADGKSLSRREAAFLNSLFTPIEHERELSRLRGVRDWQRKAGSPADRQLAHERATVTRADLDAQRPQLEAEIAALQEKLAGLTRAADNAQRVAEARDQAVEVLRQPDRLPPHLQLELRRLQREYAERFGVPLVTLRQRLGAIDHWLSIGNPGEEPESTIEESHEVPGRRFRRWFSNEQLESIKVYIGVGPLLDQVFPVASKSGHYVNREFSIHGWQRHLADLRAEREQVVENIRRAEEDPERVEMEAEIRKLTEFYVPA